MSIHKSVQAYDYLVTCVEARSNSDESFEVGSQYPVNNGMIYDDDGREHMVFRSKDNVFSNFATFEY